MSESNAQVVRSGVDPQSVLLQNIRQLSGVMEAAQSAGHESFAGSVSGLRSDLMNIAGMSSGYDPRPSTDVKNDLHQQGESRIQALVEQANSLPGNDGLGSAFAGRIAAAGASLASAGYVKKPELAQEADMGKAQSAAQGVVGKLAAALSGQGNAQQSATRWQDVAQRQGKDSSRGM